MKSKYTTEQTSEMQKLVDQGVAITQIASKFNCSRHTVYRHTITKDMK